jgi:two-component SAPR family response regulator
MDTKEHICKDMRQLILDWEQGKEAVALESFKQVISLARDIHCFDLGKQNEAILSQLCARALACGFELDYIQTLIHRLRLAAPNESCGELWPWHMRIYTLGRFRIELDSAPGIEHVHSGKPLELLKALVSLGGRMVSIDELAQWLWPDQEGDSACNSLNVTLYRLRKLVGSKIILQQDKKLRLNPVLCWVDVWELEKLLVSADGINGYSDMSAKVDRALVLYEGLFLAEDDDLVWAMPMRERMRSRFIRFLLAVGEHSRSIGDYRRCIELYRRGLEVDALAEDFYHRLMVVLSESGNVAESITVYQRCERMLDALLGVSPSLAMQDEFNRIRHNAGVSKRMSANLGVATMLVPQQGGAG